MDRAYKLLMHENQHGYGVSLMVYDGDNLKNGFVLVTFPRAENRDKYVSELTDLTGFEIDAL